MVSVARLLKQKRKKESISMIDLFKKIWAGPFVVKSSLVFLLFVLLVFFLAAPGQTMLLFSLVFAVYNIIEWVAKEDE